MKIFTAFNRGELVRLKDEPSIGGVIVEIHIALSMAQAEPYTYYVVKPRDDKEHNGYHRLKEDDIELDPITQ